MSYFAYTSILRFQCSHDIGLAFMDTEKCVTVRVKMNLIRKGTFIKYVRTLAEGTAAKL